MKIAKLISILAVAAVLAGCCYCQQYQRKYGRPLKDTRWTLVQLDGRPVEGNYVLVLTSDEGIKISGDAQIGASYSANNEGRIFISDVKAESVYEGVPAQITSKLPTTNSYKMDGPFLMLIRDGEMWGLFEAKDPKK